MRQLLRPDRALDRTRQFTSPCSAASVAARRLALHGPLVPPPITTGAVIYVIDVPRLTEFYSAVAGLSVTSSAPDHAILESGPFQLVIHAVPTSIAATIEIASPPIRREDTPIKLIFLVPSISVAREVAHAHGGQLNPAEREWSFQIYRVCDGHDPEGNVIQLREIAR